MVEVKEHKSGGVGLYATKSYKAGEIILQESPIITLAPKKSEHIAAIRDQFQNIKEGAKISQADKCLHDLIIPDSIDTKLKSEFRGMLIAAASYALEENDTVKSKVQELYVPNLDDNENQHEKKVIILCEDAMSFLKKQRKTDSKLHKLIDQSPIECKKIMLIWSCNSFKGGYIYERTSRINHSCDFNAVVSTNNFSNDDEEQTIRAACSIQEGGEIAISYLGSFTYSDQKLRNEKLVTEKFFTCHCERCERERSSGDMAASMPCPNCHPRIGRYLDEDVQYDDGEVEVQYCVSSLKGDTNQIIYNCEKCGEVKFDETLLNAIEKAIERSTSHLNQDLFGLNEIDDDEGDRNSKIEMTERLACLATSVLGAKHWATILLTFVMLSAKLSSLHATMLCKSASGSDSKKEKDEENAETMDDIAECINSLDRINSYMQSLKLQSHVGHLVGNVSVGVSRVLVGFGDVKSMKYGSTFASAVFDDYFKLGFEGEAMEKVAETLIHAWERKFPEGDSTSDGSRKKQKVK